MEQLEAAIQVSLDPHADLALKQQASLFCSQFRESNESYQICLSGYLDTSRSESVRFFCLQVLEEVVRSRYSSLEPGHGVILRQSLWKSLNQSLAQPFYLRMRLLAVLVLLFQNQYPNEWPDFFDSVLALSEDPSYVDVFLRICLMIDEEVVSLHFSRSVSQLSRNTELKDWMRENAIPRLVESWFRILFVNFNSDSEVPRICLQLLGLYVSWIDINLIVRQDFINALYELFKSPSLRASACDCLTEIIGKGMKPSEKLALIKALNILTLLPSMHFEDDIEFDEHVAKLVNIIGLELCSVYNDSIATDVDRSAALEALQQLFPEWIRLLGSEYDDTSSALFTFISHYFSLMKRLKKTLTNAVSKDNLLSLLQVIVLKTKYDEEEEYHCGPDAGEEEALFLDLRKTLKTFMESICFLDDDLFVSFITQCVGRYFSALADAKSRNAPLRDALPWSEAELALHLLYIFAEAKPYRLSSTQLLEEKVVEYGALIQMMKMMVESGVSGYQHESIPILFFETVGRYYPFFEKYPQYLPSVLESFIDERGLHHPLKFIRLRVFYLFLRFVKNLKLSLAPFVRNILPGIQDLLTVKPRPIPQQHAPGEETDGSVACDFDSQVYLFEAAGYLISLEDIPESQQTELLTVVISPLLGNLEAFMTRISQLPTPYPQEFVWELSDIITAIGSISKGFPDYAEKPGRTPTGWSLIFQQSLRAIIVVLGKLSEYGEIREAARFAFHRMFGCLGPEVLEHVPSFLSAGLLSSQKIDEVAEFMPFISLLIHKFKSSIKEILTSLWKPLSERIFYFLEQQTLGTDDAIQKTNLQKSFLSLLGILFTSGLQSVLTAPENASQLNKTLLWVCSLVQLNDPVLTKNSFALFTKMVLSWAGSASSPQNTISQNTLLSSEKRGMVGAAIPLGKDLIHRDPLPGFDNFVFEQIVPLMFQIPLAPEFKLEDGQSLLALTEIAGLHKALLDVMSINGEYVRFLTGLYLPSLGLSEPIITEFVKGLQSLDKKALKNHLQDFISWGRANRSVLR